VLAAECGGGVEEFLLGEGAFPEGFERELELAVATHAREAEGRSTKGVCGSCAEVGHNFGFSPVAERTTDAQACSCARAHEVADSTDPIHESGSVKRTHGERVRALPRWWLQAGIRTQGRLVNRRFPSLSGDSALALRPRDRSFPSPLRDSAGVSPASRLTERVSSAPTGCSLQQRVARQR